MILDDVDRLVAFGAENFVRATLKEAPRSQHIGNMDSVHPVNPFGLNAGLDGYRDAVYDHNVCPQSDEGSPKLAPYVFLPDHSPNEKEISDYWQGSASLHRLVGVSRDASRCAFIKFAMLVTDCD